MKRFFLSTFLISSFSSRSVLRLGRVSIVATLLCLGGCDPASDDAEVLPHDHWFRLTVDDKVIRAQLAVTLPEMRRGLMHREALEENSGMLFVYQRPQGMNFYMRNTPLPLDIGFFSPEGQLRERYAMYPFDETPILSQGENLQFALEMNQGWFSENNIRPGARLDLDKLADALRKRGFEPVDFGL